MSVPVASGLTYDDLWELPQDDGLRRELMDGELYVSPSPVVRHQRVVAAIAFALSRAAEQDGGEVLFAPLDVVFGPDTVVEPDVLYLGAETWRARGDERFIDVVPDLLVEVSSPSTRRLDLIHKRNLYERVGLPEYWFVDLDLEAADLATALASSQADPEIAASDTARGVIDVYRLDDSGRFGMPQTLQVGDRLRCTALPTLDVGVEDVLPGD